MNNQGIYRRLLVMFSFVAGVLPILFLFISATSEPVQAADGILYVAPSAVCGSASPCFGSIQTAVDSAADGEEIHVAAGTYTDIHARNGITQVLYISKTVTIQGGYSISNWSSPNPTTNPTTLDALALGRVIYITRHITPTVSGFRITGGDATGLGGAFNDHDGGGGIYISDASAVIKNCVIYSNTAYFGGGIYANSSPAVIHGNIITSNMATNLGGGIGFENNTARVYSNSIISNTASQGAGAYLFWDNSTLDNNSISNNVSSHNIGGGLYLQGGNNLVNNNLINNNIAGCGGGLVLMNSNAEIYHNKILSNATISYGSGIYIASGTPILFNNVIAKNSISDDYPGCAFFIFGGAVPNLIHNTIVSNTCGNMAAIQIESFDDNYSNVEITNTILVSHTAGISVTSGNTATINGILWFNTPVTLSQATTANVSIQNQWLSNPFFDTDEYHLTPGSAAIDRGVPTTVLFDIDNQPRFPIPDLGADEFWQPGYPKYAYLPIILR
ncbi:MAG: right-handed parallel beta-helix repeat-containing protein [Anaerolineales bacterium]|nr:right-handed parallel beta-helix repeat-containing protein [Anaerolineales bacterium]